MVLAYAVLIVAALVIVWGVVRLLRWRGAWMLLALVAMVPFVLVGSNVIQGVAADPTSHNLWPFEVGLALIGSLAIVVLGAVVRGIMEQRGR